MYRTKGFQPYIWQQPDWPRFRWDSEALIAPIERVMYLHGRLLGQMSMVDLAKKNDTELLALVDELINTSAIEGIQLKADSVRSSLARKLGVEDDGLLIEDHYVEGLTDVMMDAVRNCLNPLSTERLFGWHSALFPTGHSGMQKITVGDWRQGDEPMQVVSGAFGHEKVHYQAPPTGKVATLMKEFIDWVNATTLSPLIASAVAHLWFVSIHPFDDGNGRISRTITDMLLARINPESGRYYSMSAEINRNKKAYYTILEQTQKGSMDITEWLLWFLDCHERALERALDAINLTIKKAVFWDSLGDVVINERQRKIINRLLDGFEGKLTTSKWAKICGCSQDTALRDIKDLISKSLLRDSGEAGRRTNYLLIE